MKYQFNLKKDREVIDIWFNDIHIITFGKECSLSENQENAEKFIELVNKSDWFIAPHIECKKPNPNPPIQKPPPLHVRDLITIGESKKLKKKNTHKNIRVHQGKNKILSRI
jgi:hypothetical protein